MNQRVTDFSMGKGRFQFSSDDVPDWQRLIATLGKLPAGDVNDPSPLNRLRSLFCSQEQRLIREAGVRRDIGNEVKTLVVNKMNAALSLESFVSIQWSGKSTISELGQALLHSWDLSRGELEMLNREVLETLLK